MFRQLAYGVRWNPLHRLEVPRTMVSTVKGRNGVNELLRNSHWTEGLFAKAGLQLSCGRRLCYRRAWHVVNHMCFIYSSNRLPRRYWTCSTSVCFYFGVGIYSGRYQLRSTYDRWTVSIITTKTLTTTPNVTLWLRWTALSTPNLTAFDICNPIPQVTLPPKDPILAPGMFGEGESGPRHFDFSDAPDVPGFNSSSECAADYTLGDYWAYMAFLARSESQTMDLYLPRQWWMGASLMANDRHIPQWSRTKKWDAGRQYRAAVAIQAR